jgi:hypothetical protein
LDEFFPLLNIFANEAASEGFSATIKAVFMVTALRRELEQKFLQTCTLFVEISAENLILLRHHTITISDSKNPFLLLRRNRHHNLHF